MRFIHWLHWVCLFFTVFLVSWGSLCWTFTPENYIENFTMALTPQTAHLDRSVRSAVTMKVTGCWFAMSCATTLCECEFLYQEETGGEVASSPPESSFQKLAPSETRYTILSRDRDELWPEQPSSNPLTQCHAPGSGRMLGLGQASGTEQQHPTPLLKR